MDLTTLLVAHLATLTTSGDKTTDLRTYLNGLSIGTTKDLNTSVRRDLE